MSRKVIALSLNCHWFQTRGTSYYQQIGPGRVIRAAEVKPSPKGQPAVDEAARPDDIQVGSVCAGGMKPVAKKLPALIRQKCLASS